MMVETLSLDEKNFESFVCMDDYFQAQTRTFCLCGCLIIVQTVCIHIIHQCNVRCNLVIGINEAFDDTGY